MLASWPLRFLGASSSGSVILADRDCGYGHFLSYTQYLETRSALLSQFKSVLNASMNNMDCRFCSALLLLGRKAYTMVMPQVNSP